MLLNVLIVDDEEEVLESLVPGFLKELSRRLAADPTVKSANEAAGFPLPKQAGWNVKLSVHNFASRKAGEYKFHYPAHVHVHLCCEKGGSFRHALRLLKDQFMAVVVSDLRFSEDMMGQRAGRFFIEDVRRRNPETFGILYSAYQRPENFPVENFVRKGSAGNLAGEELLSKIVEGVAFHLNQPGIRRLHREVHQRGLVFQSDAFGSTLKRLYDCAELHFGKEIPDETRRRRPRPTLLLDGETGTGKTELARLLHELSDRRSEPFQYASCNQLTNENMLRSTLFGHVKGAYTGAAGDRQGLVAAAGRGILLLDDLHAISEDCSVILHSFLDDGEYAHLGQDEVRRHAQNAIVSTVETPRWQESRADGKLPESFINRVEQLVIRIPPLRDRPEDIVVQSQSYCQAFSKSMGEEMELSPAATAWMIECGFPSGNSRKLRDFVKGLVTENAKTTDYLDLGEVVDFARGIGLSAKPTTVTVPAALVSPIAPEPAEPKTPTVPWPTPDRDPANWQARIARLATRALELELKLNPDEAERACQQMFGHHLVGLWKTMQTMFPANKELDIKLFDELLRYFVVFLTGSPAKAARELGMKDNALREFIYSREQKRLPDDDVPAEN